MIIGQLSQSGCFNDLFGKRITFTFESPFSTAWAYKLVTCAMGLQPVEVGLCKFSSGMGLRSTHQPMYHRRRTSTLPRWRVGAAMALLWTAAQPWSSICKAKPRQQRGHGSSIKKRKGDSYGWEPTIRKKGTWTSQQKLCWYLLDVHFGGTGLWPATKQQAKQLKTTNNSSRNNSTNTRDKDNTLPPVATSASRRHHHHHSHHHHSHHHHAHPRHCHCHNITASTTSNKENENTIDHAPRRTVD